MAWTPCIRGPDVLWSRARAARREAAATVEASRAVLAQATVAVTHALAICAQVPALTFAFAAAGEGGGANGHRTATRPRVAGPPRPTFAIAAEVVDGLATVIVSGDVDLATVPEVERCLESHADSPRLLVDLAAVRFLDSCGMTALVRAMRRAARSGQQLELRPPADAAVLRALEITGLLTALPFDDAPD